MVEELQDQGIMERYRRGVMMKGVRKVDRGILERNGTVVGREFLRKEI